MLRTPFPAASAPRRGTWATSYMLAAAIMQPLSDGSRGATRSPHLTTSICCSWCCPPFAGQPPHAVGARLVQGLVSGPMVRGPGGAAEYPIGTADGSRIVVHGHHDCAHLRSHSRQRSRTTSLGPTFNNLPVGDFRHRDLVDRATANPRRSNCRSMRWDSAYWSSAWAACNSCWTMAMKGLVQLAGHLAAAATAIVASFSDPWD